MLPPKLITYASKGLPPPAGNNLVMELELLGLGVNISQLIHLLAKV